MSKEFTLADPGEGLQEAEILEVHVSVGDQVEDGDTVLTVETDKANTEIPAPFSGTIEEVKVSEGDTAEVGDVLMTYNEGQQDSGGSNDADQDDQDDQDDRQKSDGSEHNAGEQDDGKKAEEGDENPPHEKNVEMGDIDDGSDEQEARQESQGEDQAPEAAGHDTPVPAAPSTRRLAREKNVELADIEPSGNEGRVTAEDVEAAAQKTQGSKQGAQASKGRQGGSALIPGGGQAPTLPDFSQWGEVERTPLRSIRRATAKNMARSWGQIPHVYHQDVADVTDLDRFRREHENAAEIDGGKFTLTVLVMKALASALREFPRFNASLDVDNQDIVLKQYCHIGLAVATDRGLLVPVIGDVDQKSLVQLSTETTAIARKTRDGDIERADMQGGSITITNPGPMGGTSLTPIINYPQVAILGMAQAQWQPIVQGDGDNYSIEPRLCLPLILGFDHRVNDGADAAQFVTHLKNSLADPESLLLSL